MTNTPYERWLTERRAASAPATLADAIMCHVTELERQRRALWWLCMVQRIEQSRAAQWAVCGGAMAIGCLPFVFFARVAQLLQF
jgi:hypothetical protein